MNIQTNYNQPSFKADFAKDPQTRNNLREMVKESTIGGYPMYLTIKSLQNLNTEDTLSVHKHADSTWLIKNTRTGDFIRINRVPDRWNKYKNAIPNIYTCNGQNYYDLSGALCHSIGLYAGHLFKDLKNKDKVLKSASGARFNQSAQERREFKRHTNGYEINKKIIGLKEQIAELENKKVENGKRYALSLIG